MVDVVTNRYDNTRLGANLNETVLNRSNVNRRQFGKLFSLPVDGDVFGQPLIVSGVKIDRETRTVAYVATSSNSLHAFDVQDADSVREVWRLTQAQLGAPVPRGLVGGDRYRDFAATIGITSTPAIDKESQTIYFETKSIDYSADKPRYVHHLHARDLATGRVTVGPREVTARVPGTAVDAKNGKITFHPLEHLNRPGLLLMNGIVYLAYGSHGDHYTPDSGAYHGWVLAYRARDLEPVGAFCATSAGNQGGIWQSGAGVCGDGTNVYCVAGNGQGHPGPCNLGNSVMKLKVDQITMQLNLVASFTPRNVQDLNINDLDLSTGAVYLSRSSLVLACSKAGTCYVLNQQEAGGQLPPVQTFSATTYSPFGDEVPPPNTYSHIHGTPVIWDDPDAPTLYVWGEHDYLRSFRWTGAEFKLVPGQSPMHVPPGMPGGFLTLSAHSSQADSAILWAAHPYTEDANQTTVDGILRAFDANDLTRELWNSEQLPTRDRLGKFAKFCPPVVANGRVYMATFADPLDTRAHTEVVVYGLLAAPADAPSADWSEADIGTPLVGSMQLDSGQMTVTGSGWDIELTRDEFHFAYQRVSGDCTLAARVVSLEKTDVWAKAGLMIRSRLEPQSAHAMIVLTPSNGAAFQWRAATAVPQVDAKPELQTFDDKRVSAPFYLRIQRNNKQVSGFTSTDGELWNMLGQQELELDNDRDEVLIGFAVTSHRSHAEDRCFNTAVFDNISLNGRQIK